MTRSLKTLVLGSLAVAGALASGLVHAGGNAYWSVSVSAPGYPVGVGATFSNAPGVMAYPQPVYVAPPPVMHAPRPVIYAPAPVYMGPRLVAYGPPAYYYANNHSKRRHHHHHDRRHGD